jgi:hypothetical protein
MGERKNKGLGIFIPLAGFPGVLTARVEEEPFDDQDRAISAHVDPKSSGGIWRFYYVRNDREQRGSPSQEFTASRRLSE